MDAEGAVSQVTRATQPLRRMRWSPDGERIAFVMFVEEEDADPLPIEQPQPPPGAEWTEPSRVVSRLKYREERVGYVDSGYWQIHVVPASGGTAVQLTHGPWNHGVETFTSGTPDGRPWTLEWTPDGREIVYTTLRLEDA